MSDVSISPSPACIGLAELYGIERAVECELQGTRYPTLQQAGIRRIVDTTRLDAEDAGWHGPLGFAAAVDPEAGEAVCYHVTDDPERVADRLRSCLPIASGRDVGKYGDLGPGLYCSNAPQVWMGRSRRKWDFLARLTPAQKTRLEDYLEAQVEDEAHRGYISEREREYAVRTIGYVRDGRNPADALVVVAEQPYNVRFAEPKVLEPLGIQPGAQPTVVEVKVRGRFAEVEGHPSWDVVDALRRAGLHGAFHVGGWTGSPQLVTWDDAAVREFDGVRPECR